MDRDSFRFIVTGEYKFVNEQMEVEDGHYLSGALFTDHDLETVSEDEELFKLHDYVVQIAYIDPHNDFQPVDILSPFVPGPLTSADGIPIRTSGIGFCLSIVGQSRLSSTQEFDSVLVFGSDNYTQGIEFECIGENCFRSLLSNDYLSLDDTFRLTSNVPTTLRLVPVKRKSMFVFSDDIHFYRMCFNKASHGEAQRVDKLDEATVFQFICPGVIKNS